MPNSINKKFQFRPCIDIRNGKVTQVVGSTLNDNNNNNNNHNNNQSTSINNNEVTNFISDKTSDYYAKLYVQYNLTGGHIIMLGSTDENKQQALLALHTTRNRLQIGGGINDTNAQYWLDNGATHIIVTSYVFHDGVIDYDRLNKLVQLVGKKRIVLDLSCRQNNS